MSKRNDLMLVERVSLWIFAIALVIACAAYGVRRCSEEARISESVPQLVLTTDTATTTTDTVKVNNKSKGKKKKKPANSAKPVTRDYVNETL